ncbi:MAG: hypothetical protein IJM35_09960 [Bacteroidales bacterium]|nr:hypothetical protein [Bacteroidales bacterium]
MLVIPLVVFFIGFLLVVGPAYSIFMGLKYPDVVDDRVQFDRDLHNPKDMPKKTPEEIEAEIEAFREKIIANRFDVPRDALPFEPDTKEIIFYTPYDAPEIENAISSNYEEIKALFEKKGYRLFFPPCLYQQYGDGNLSSVLDYYNPRTDKEIGNPQEFLSYPDIKAALSIPDKVDAPSFIRCKRNNSDPLLFTFWKIEIKEGENIVDAVKDYLNMVGDNILYSVVSDQQILDSLQGLPADERFDKDVYLIGKEIRDRIEQLRAKGLSSLAIKKLIGDDSEKPGKLLIDKHHKLYLTDFGNKEIRMEPLQKAVFFLFLRHPEGIYFKDLADYRDELGAIYKEITGRDDTAGIERSIQRLTDPFDNSINEKCARIKNAFVSEFREEVAQWYFIDGNRGEKKTIKLPRELVTWEIKD